MCIIALALLGTSCTDETVTAPAAGEIDLPQELLSDQKHPTIQLPPGYQIEKVVGGLTFPTSIAWDEEGRLHVVESGSGLTPNQLAPPRILRVQNGQATEVINLDGRVGTAVVGIVWHKGAFYITHRDVADRTDAVSRVGLDGSVTKILSGIVDGQSEHQINDIRAGPDGELYVTVGLPGNAGVVSNELAGFIKLSPGLHGTPCRDIVLTGENYQTPDFRTPDATDSVLTGAYVPFGTPTQPGQVISGSNKCGGSILAFDPSNAQATLRMHAWGFRNPIGIAFNRRTGDLYMAMNGFDIRGSRPIDDEWDATYRVRRGVWYGSPDFTAALDPVTDPRFEPPDALQAPVFVNGQPQGKVLRFVIDHAASGLTPPSKSLIAGLHPFQSSPSMLDVAPQSWRGLAGNLFIAEFGDLRPPTNPLVTGHVGFRIARLDPSSGQVQSFVRNLQVGPASEQGARGQGLERVFDVEFGPDGAMYIVDYGEVQIDLSRIAQGMAPYVEIPRTGVIWRVTRAAPVAGLPLYRVTIQNLTTGQPFSPGVIATHTDQATVFRVGQQASEGIRRIAEDGDPVVALSETRGTPGVFDVVKIGHPIHPDGGSGPSSATFSIEARDGVNRLSLATMLICTNDGFTGLDAVPLPTGFDPVVFHADGYDAGTEANDELSSHIVDPCGTIGPVAFPPDGNARTPTIGVITHHPNITGVGNLVPAQHAWRNRVARITVQRVR
jgi:glucose/arabinose dehydrogenase